MTIAEAHYQFKLNMDRIDSLSKQDFNVAEIDWLLNEAQLVFVKQRASQSNQKRQGFEASQKRIDDLSTLVIKYPVQAGLVPVLDDGVYEIDLSNLSYKYLQLVSASAEVKLSEDCLKKVPLRFIQHDDYLTAIRDPFNSGSLEFIPFNYGRSSNGGSTSLYVYPNDYIITFVYPEYIKYPSQVSYGNYTYIDGNNYATTDFELPDHTHQEIVDIACQIASLNIENPEYLQLKQGKVFIHE